MNQDISITTQERVTTITLTRPEKKNAITQAMYAAMAEAIKDYDTSDTARALMITGQGDYFTAGNDLQDFARGMSDSELPPVARFLEAISTCSKPVIAAVNGSAIGVGLTMLLHCDIVVIARSAKLSAPFVKLGLVPEAASSMLLPQAVGPAMANDIFYTGRALDAEESLAYGLASRIFDDGELAERAREIALQISNAAPNSVRLTKSLIRRNAAEISQRIQDEGKHFSDQLASPEFAECVAAMLEKRAPSFA